MRVRFGMSRLWTTRGDYIRLTPPAPFHPTVNSWVFPTLRPVNVTTLHSLQDLDFLHIIR